MPWITKKEKGIMSDPAAYSLTQRQVLAREYNEAHSPIPLKKKTAIKFARTRSPEHHAASTYEHA